MALLCAGFFFGRSGHSFFYLISPAFDISSDPPAVWTRRDVGPFVLYLPPDLEVVPTRGIDSFVEEYRGRDFSLSFDYGWYSDPLKYRNRPRYKRQLVSVDGFSAWLVSFHDPSQHREFPAVIAIHFRNVSPVQKRDKNRLTLYARCRSEEQYPLLRHVFSSLRFAKWQRDTSPQTESTRNTPARKPQ